MNSKVIAQLAKQHNKAKHKRKDEQKAKKTKMCMHDNKSTIAKFDSIFLETKNYQIMNCDAYINKANILTFIHSNTLTFIYHV
jgi:hypothetical protein